MYLKEPLHIIKRINNNNNNCLHYVTIIDTGAKIEHPKFLIYSFSH